MTCHDVLMQISRALIAAALGLALQTSAWAQQYPSKPVRFIIPYPAGSSSNDIFGRVLAQRLSDTLGQQFVVDNRAGASGHIGRRAGGQSGARRLYPAARHQRQHRHQPERQSKISTIP